MVIRFHNGSYIRCIGSENYMVANGLTPHIAVYDEFKGFNPRWHIEFAPNRAAKAAPLIIIGTKPRAGNKNMDQYNEILEYMRKDPKGCHVADRGTWDNPINHLPAQKKQIEFDIAQLIARGEEDVVQLEYYSKVIPGGKRAVFPMLRKEKHFVPYSELYSEIAKDLKKVEWYLIADPGTTTRFGALFVAMNQYTGKIYILDEIYEGNQLKTSTKYIVPQMKSKILRLYPTSNIHDDWSKHYDDAGAWFSTEALAQYGWYFSPVEKWRGDKEEGLSLIKDVLIYEMLRMSDKCENLYSEMEKYAKNDKGVVPKGNDHLIDCLRYLMIVSNYDFETVTNAVINTDPLHADRFRRMEDDELLNGSDQLFNGSDYDLDWVW
jgi:hypothetical protein